MSAYIIANVKVTDAAQYEIYKKLSSHAMAVHGAEVCVRGGAVEVLEGDWQPSRLVVLEFENLAAAERWYESAAYQAAKKLREGGARMRMVAVKGLESG